MQGDGPTRFGLRSCTLRSLFVCTICVAATIMLIWIYKEEVTHRRCTQLDAAGSAAVRQAPAHFDVVVNVPAQNVTYGGKIVAQGGETEAVTGERKWNYNWDRKAWDKPSDANGVPTRTIVLVRHGQYDLNTGHLTEKGKQQANLTGIRLKALGLAYDRIIHSTLDRAVETAGLVHAHLSHLPMESDPMVAEGGPLPPEPTLNYWRLPDRNYFVDGPRLEAAFRKYFYRAAKSDTRETIDILVGHGNIFRYFVLRALQFPADGWMRVFIPHASVSLLHINPDGSVTMTKFGDSGHLPPDLVTI